jgi:excisionase family DNA binding protein
MVAVMTPMITEAAVAERWYLRPKQVAELVGLSESEVYRSIYSGQLRATKYKSKVWLVTRADVEEWISENSEPSAA